MCDAGTFVSITEAAQLLETTEMRVLMMLKHKELIGKLENDAWYVDRASLLGSRKPEAGAIVKPGCGGCGGH
ncbi:MAG TPA: hypothetical protein VIH45_08705 [Desulfuromonadaceae bacterium]